LLAACCAVLAVSCASSGPTRAPQLSRPAEASSAPELAWHYDVRLVAGGELAVEARFDTAIEGPLTVDGDATAFVKDVQFQRAGCWVAATEQDNAWQLPCAASCRVRYRFQLRQACLGLNEADTALASGDVLIAPPSTWLLHPGTSPKHAELELQVEPGPGQRFVSAFRRAPDGRPDHYRAATAVLDDASYAAFGPLDVAQVPAGDGTVELAIAPAGLALSSEQARAWVMDSAGAIASYYQGHLPARRTLLLLMHGGGENTRGLTLGGGGPAVLVRASDLVTPVTTRDDWVIAHELLHANFPDLGREHSWLSEGLATYLEPIARARVGLLSEAEVWRGLWEGLPEGLPEAGDQGLERTRTWGRTYWGGALFCLMADLTLRERSGNQHSLDDVILAIGKTGATDEDFWPMERVLSVAERATNSPVLRELYERLAERPGTVDLSALFARLGVRAQGGTVVFDDSAPLAHIRRSIAARRPG